MWSGFSTVPEILFIITKNTEDLIMNKNIFNYFIFLVYNVFCYFLVVFVILVYFVACFFYQDSVLLEGDVDVYGLCYSILGLLWVCIPFFWICFFLLCEFRLFYFFVYFFRIGLIHLVLVDKIRNLFYMDCWRLRCCLIGGITMCNPSLISF